MHIHIHMHMLALTHTHTHTHTHTLSLSLSPAPPPPPPPPAHRKELGTTVKCVHIIISRVLSEAVCVPVSSSQCVATHTQATGLGGSCIVQVPSQEVKCLIFLIVIHTWDRWVSFSCSLSQGSVREEARL